MKFSLKQLVVIVLTTISLSTGMIFYIQGACADTITFIEKSFVQKTEIVRVEESLKSINQRLERIENKMDQIIDSR
jgi:hypothetical protein